MGTSQSTSVAAPRLLRENTGLSSSSEPLNQRKKTRGSSSSLATLRRRLLLRRRRSSKCPDHARHMRDLLSGCSLAEVSALCEQYEALAALKDLSVQADLARPPASAKKLDLAALFEARVAADVELVYAGACFPAHRAVLAARCPYFRQVLGRFPGHGARIGLELRTPGVDAPLFGALLKLLYTGELAPHQHDRPLLARLADEFGGAPNPLEQDLRYLLETGDFADAMLVFTKGNGSSSSSSSSGHSEYGFSSLGTLELPCHKAVLAARSPFFRNLVQRRNRGEELQPERAGLNLATRIVLDESVIPQRFARVLLHAVYLDVVDLGLVHRPLEGGPSALEDAMELYQIGRFLELDILSQGCEDLILEMLAPQNLAIVLAWGARPYGSAWVYRQAVNYLRDEFQPISQSGVLLQLSAEHLREALSSDFLQASELEVLQAVLKWGEHQLVRRMEDREPNLLSHTAHSVARKGVKKRDLSDVELREILSPLLPLVRMDHVLPAHAETLAHAVRRGLLPTPPSHMLGGDRDAVRIHAWIRSTSGCAQGVWMRPRLFMPYYEEAKAVLEEHFSQAVDVVRAAVRRPDDIPDTLYMVDERRNMEAAGANPPPPLPDAATLGQMVKREQKMRQSPLVLRALSLPLTSRHLVLGQVRLRVVREFNLPDATAQLLENASGLKDQEEAARRRGPFARPLSASQEHLLYSRRRPEADVGADGHLSEVMPDVAMATSSFGQLELEESEIELDLGDGYCQQRFFHY
ncbi:BTB/POZ domain-containing protein 7 isoform X2 [Neocloeon triangulifer]|uniref:BTB/POZ domain-containing protein 7 isoform X2 n=1 Tax=Neocloeon triangulifer TaxID=2078957 RepID=UPI00286F176D|nr:BTB/POZ domain-containing protein 7 isoform X2 [Neocloeon triangulifer]